MKDEALHTEYMLDVYSDKDLVEHFRSVSPFMKVEIGEFMHSGIFSAWEGPPRILEVTDVVHSVRRANGGLIHQLLVYTEATDRPPEGIHLTAPYRG